MGNDEMERFLEYVYVNSRMLRKGMLESLDRAVSMLGCESGLYRKMRKVRNMVACGEGFGSAITAHEAAYRIADKCIGKYAHVLAHVDGREFSTGIEDMHRELLEERSTHESIAYGSMQKYLTANMLFSTVLPSMAMFGFVGYSLIDYSGEVMFVFLLALLVALPAAYAAMQYRIGLLDG